MNEKRSLALLGFIFGLVAGVLILVSALSLGRSFTLEGIAAMAVRALLGIAVLFGSLLIYRSTTNVGAFVNLIVGILGLFALGIGTTESVLAILSGVFGFVASGSLR